MKILVTGGRGQLGHDVVEELTRRGIDAVGVDIEEMDVTDKDSVDSVVRGAAPDAVIHCAAYTAVDAAEENEELCRRVNADGPRNIAGVCRELDIKMLQVSTDYVFDGRGDNFWRPEDECHPQSVYGQTKYEGELAVQNTLEKYFIVRIAWSFGVNGKNFVKTMLRLSETNDKVRVVMDQVGSPTSAGELAKAIACLLPTENYGLFHGTCEGITNWADFTREIYRLAGKSTAVETVTTEQYGKSVTGVVAPRPAYSVLENYMLKLTTDYMFADWQKAAAEYIKGLSF